MDSDLVSKKTKKMVGEKEKTEKSGRKVVQKDAKVETKKIERAMFVLTEQNVDLNLNHTSNANVKNTTCCLNPRNYMSSKIVYNMDKKGNSYEFPSLSFLRYTSDAKDKHFEFNLPLQLAPAIKIGIEHIIACNPTFFANTVAGQCSRDE
jgi:hypothetical protein